MTVHEDTIAAISTPLGEGGIGIVRLSGPAAIQIATSVFVSSTGADITAAGRRVFHGEVVQAGIVLDEVLLHVMRSPHSYTREDVVEFNCHGGLGPLRAVLEATLSAGARLAEPGEFTKRAFLNGRIDLIQAEAVIDRIRARTTAGLRAASAAASGVLSRTLEELKQGLQRIQAQIETAVDFPEDDLPETVTEALRSDILSIRERMAALLATAEAGRLFREGTSVAIAGRPNVGKSSLFNALLRDARAIVTSVPGTTRDLIEETVNVEGIPVRLTDTAGLRDSHDEVERIGIQAARRAMEQAAAIIFVMDASAPATTEDAELARELADLGVPLLLVLNKIDQAPDVVAPRFDVEFASTCHVSALTGEGLDTLEKGLADVLLGEHPISPDETMLTRVHQRDSLGRAAAALDRLIDHFQASPEILSIDVREALRALGEITGETTPDDILQHIFASFCIGK